MNELLCNNVVASCLDGEESRCFCIAFACGNVGYLVTFSKELLRL